MSRYAQMQSLKGMTEEQRKAILTELDSIKVGDVDEDGNEVVEVIDVDLPGEDKADEEAEDQTEAADDTVDEDAKSEDQTAEDDEVEDALKALSDAIAKLKAKLRA